MRGKSWPYWNDWKFIFGKDESVTAVEKNFQERGIIADIDSSSDYQVFIGDIFAIQFTNSLLDTLSIRIGYDMDLDIARQEIFRHLDNMAELSDAQRYDLCDIIRKENSLLEIFIWLPVMKETWLCHPSHGEGIPCLIRPHRASQSNAYLSLCKISDSVSRMKWLGSTVPSQSFMIFSLIMVSHDSESRAGVQLAM
ncbi:hypothetical protein SASPL_148619 [Salvia splendens]|uniref:Uncharacterized protein n=1 Tax=Salvia splendens TaxID=180675 RepID=A0A8X8WAL8_SALSN|nr:hypothetical protein SASPL_148619 [Salvia splendens]